MSNQLTGINKLFRVKFWAATMLNKNDVLIQITAFFWLVQKLLSWKLWVTERTIPIVPCFDILENTPGFIHWFLLGASIFLLLYLLIWPNEKSLQIVLIILEIASCTLDQNRWQPWEYQYLFILFIVVINKNKQVLPVFLFVMACIYFYSGFYKFNSHFLPQIWDKMILKDFLKLDKSIRHISVLYYSGFIIPIVELLGGLGLMIKKYRKATALLLIGMHSIILIILGPWGLQYNQIIWPWNVAMIIFLLYIIYHESSIPFKWVILFNGWNKLVFISWLVLPILCIWGWWDNFLSANVYSGSTPNIFICVNDSSKLKFPSGYYLKNETPKICAGKITISLQKWAMAEINVPVIPQLRVYKKIEADFLKKHPNVGAVFVYVY